MSNETDLKTEFTDKLLAMINSINNKDVKLILQYILDNYRVELSEDMQFYTDIDLDNLIDYINYLVREEVK